MSHVVECKWSEKKPWVLFSAPELMAPSACVAQTIASELGTSILWVAAGDSRLHALDLFQTPARPGFNGRQALSTGGDLFFQAM